MTLAEYMKLNSLSENQVAERLGCSPGAVRKWRYGDRVPRPEQMRKIADLTGGSVTANDFLAPPSEAA